MTYLLFFISLIQLSFAHDPIKVAIVDTGLDLKDARFSPLLCQGHNHKDYTNTGMEDTLGHGTHVTGLIKQYAGDSDYCILVYKYFSYDKVKDATISQEVEAFHQAIEDGAEIINFSGGGPKFSESEYWAIKQHPDVTFIVAAGNDNMNLNLPNNHFYPASHRLSNVIAVGNGTGVTKYNNSNWADWLIWENGKDAISTVPCILNPYDCTLSMSGTSMSTAIHTGKYIKSLLRPNP